MYLGGKWRKDNKGKREKKKNKKKIGRDEDKRYQGR